MTSGTTVMIINDSIFKEMMCCFYDITVRLVKDTIFNCPRSLGGSLMRVRAGSFMAPLVR